MTALRSLSVRSEWSLSLLNLAHVGLNFACIASPVCSAKFDKPHEWNSTNNNVWFECNNFEPGGHSGPVCGYILEIQKQIIGSSQSHFINRGYD